MKQYNLELVALINQAKAKFINKEDVTTLYGDVMLYTTEFNGKTYNFFGIDKDLQANTDYSKVKAEMYKVLGYDHSNNITQLIGDSACFNKKESLFAIDYFANYMKEHKDDVLLYGFTGHDSPDGRLDVNEVITDWLKKNPEQSNKVIANIVCFHTPKAIKDWKCSISDKITNFFLVYSPIGQGAVFGDDTISSDSITDRVLLKAGGIQSLTQASYMMARNIPVIGIDNLRGVNNPSTYDAENNVYVKYLCAAEFFNMISEAVKQNPNLEEKEVEVLKDAYLKESHLFNPYRNDAGTKPQLFKRFWDQFINDKVWNNIPNCYTAIVYKEPTKAETIKLERDNNTNQQISF